MPEDIKRYSNNADSIIKSTCSSACCISCPRDVRGVSNSHNAYSHAGWPRNIGEYQPDRCDHHGHVENLDAMVLMNLQLPLHPCNTLVVCTMGCNGM